MSDFYDFLRRHEGFNPKAYPDHKQWSIGYGTRAAGPDESITREEAERRMRSEADAARAQVRKFSSGIGPGPEDALTELTYNTGSKWMGSGLGRAVQAGNMPEAKNRYLQYVNASGQPLPGLKARRTEGGAWFDTATPQGAPQEAIPPVLQAGYGRESGPGATALAAAGPPAQSGGPSGAFPDLKAAMKKPLFTTPEALGGKSVSGSTIAGAAGSAFSKMGQGGDEAAARLRKNALSANADALQADAQAQNQALQSVLARRRRGAFA